MHEAGLYVWEPVSANPGKRRCGSGGGSKDSVASHKKFEGKYSVPFTLLSDMKKKIIQTYDVWWKVKKNYGKVSMGVLRTTYLIDENDIIVKGYDKMKAADNPA